MIETHVSLQSSGLKFAIPLDLVLSLVVPITPKLLVRWRGNTEHWSSPLDACWLISLYLKQSGVTYCFILNFLLIQLLLRE